MVISTQPDTELWNAFRKGDVLAYEAIYRRYAPALFSYGKRLTTDYDLVRDTIQDVFIEIWQRRENLTDLQTIKFYLFRVLRNALSRNHKKLKEEDSSDWMESWAEELLLPSIETQITEEENSEDRMLRLRKGIDKLPIRQREAIMLAFYDNLSNEEIAMVMGIHTQSVTNHLSRALQFLRNVVLEWTLVFALPAWATILLK